MDFEVEVKRAEPKEKNNESKPTALNVNVQNNTDANSVSSTEQISRQSWWTPSGILLRPPNASCDLPIASSLFPLPSPVWTSTLPTLTSGVNWMPSVPIPSFPLWNPQTISPLWNGSFVGPSPFGSQTPLATPIPQVTGPLQVTSFSPNPSVSLASNTSNQPSLATATVASIPLLNTVTVSGQETFGPASRLVSLPFPTSFDAATASNGNSVPRSQVHSFHPYRRM